MAFERSTIVEQQWAKILERAERSQFDEHRYVPFLRAARYKPHTSALTPYFGMGTLYFSRKPTYPFSKDCPYVFARRDGRFNVYDRPGSFLGELDAEEASEALERALSK